MTARDRARGVSCPTYDDDYVRASRELELCEGRETMSARATLEASSRVLERCPAHYTAWRARMKAYERLANECRDDVERFEANARAMADVEEASVKNGKNYQVWNHARAACERLASRSANGDDVKARAFAIARHAIERDGKNIHAWQHAAWCAERFGMYEEERAAARDALECDFWMNNSAMNAMLRANEAIFVTLSSKDMAKAFEEECAKVREVVFAHRAAASENESAWNYARGLKDLARAIASDDVWEFVARNIRELAEDVLSGENTRGKHSDRYAAAYVADAYAEASLAPDAAPSSFDVAMDWYSQLKMLDPVRVNYYNTKMSRLRRAREHLRDARRSLARSE